MIFLKPTDVRYKKDGLKSRDVPALRKKYGSNTVTKKPRNSFIMQFLGAFSDPIIKILLVALALNIIIAIKNADIYEPLGIAIALFLATFVSTLSEYASESAFLKLEEKSKNAECRVMRDKKLITLPASELVVGDTVYLSAGERVSADGIIFHGTVFADESSLSGETTEVRKAPSEPCNNWALGRSEQLFSGSVITSGECIMSVGRVGDGTFYGSVAAEIQGGGVKSPLTERLSALAGTLAKLAFVAAALVFFADLFNTLVIDNAFDPTYIKNELTSLPAMATNLLHALTLAITVVVVAVPEGLPMMITVVLSANMQRLRRDNVLVRKLVGIETGGALNILFTDKTGTLTTGNLEVAAFYDSTGKRHLSVPSHLKKELADSCVAGSESVLVGNRALGGNATDRALMTFACKLRPDCKVKDRIPFDSAKKYSAVLCDRTWYYKGAPEYLFEKCQNVSEALKERYRQLTTSGARVVALAKTYDRASYELIGIFEISDRLRRDVIKSVRTVKGAGIQVCMVTGDNVDTARAIAKSCGILEDGGLVLDSHTLSTMSDSEVISALPRLRVVARALPTDKSRLVRLCQSAGLVCGMTGDGINDAPALKSADVGFAMGGGTEVAKEAGDIVILDNNFTSIAKAILYGRTIFKSIRKFIVFQLTMNMCAVGVSVIGPFIGIDTPVTVLQMLWVNIIMDTLAGLAFAGEPPLNRYMKERPIKRTESVLNKKMLRTILCIGGFDILLCSLFLGLGYFRTRFGLYTDPARFMTVFFTLFIFLGVTGSFVAKTDGAGFSGVFKNKTYYFIFFFICIVQILLVYFGGRVLRTAPIPFTDVLYVGVLSLLNIVVAVLEKFIKK